MTLLKSISGIRGTIGGEPGRNLTPQDIVRFISAYGLWLKGKMNKDNVNVVVGRDGRISGGMVNDLVMATFLSQGIDVIQLGLAATPTVEMAVTENKADGGIIISASHNPEDWNGLKMLNNLGEFITAGESSDVIRIADDEQFLFNDVHSLGRICYDNEAGRKHINRILDLELVDTGFIQKSDLSVVIDGINSVGGIVVPELLRKLGVRKVFELNCEPDGHFRHNPEPLPEHLNDLAEIIVKEKADIGFAVDPDADRLVIVNEDGTMFGEEYTLVAIADYILKHKPGNTVSNLSSTSALKDLTLKYGMNYYTAAVGEINVVQKMKEVGAVIGGEGNGGVICPELHYGRDALVGIALFLSYLARDGRKCSEIRKDYPGYFNSKHKVLLKNDAVFGKILTRIKEQNAEFAINEEDGLRIDYPDGWIHVRKSNTEPAIRIISESVSKEKAVQMAEKMIGIVKQG